jgi:hypothetical protein
MIGLVWGKNNKSLYTFYTVWEKVEGMHAMIFIENWKVTKCHNCAPKL